jgi:hypothetical protein
MADELNPRLLRDKLGPFVGKKVIVGTTDFHYISGWALALEGTRLRMSVAGKPVLVPTHMVATIKEVPALQAEYVK